MRLEMESSQERALRFGVMCDGETLQEWQIRCVKQLLALANVTLALIILKDPRSRKIRDVGLSNLLFRIYSTLFVRPGERHPVSISTLCARVPTVRCRVIKRDKFSEYFSPVDVERVRAFHLDFILRLGFGILRGKILDVARYGIWSFHHDDETKYRGLPAGFWEIYSDDRVTGAILQRLTDRLDAGIVLKKGYFKTVRHSYSKNLDHVLFESARWPAQVCIDIQNGKADYLLSPPSRTRARIFRRPRNLQTFFFALKIAKRRSEIAYRLLFRHTVWNIGIVDSPIQAFLEPGFKPKVRWFPRSARGQVWADPFGKAKDGRIQILFEKLDYRQPKGIICTSEIEDRALPTEPKPAIELPVHISYPYLFDYQGETYCIPETNQARGVSVYRANEFPYRWIKVADLLQNVRAVDTTLFHRNARLWLTFTDRDRGGDANLYAWHAQDLFGPWQPHALNPVKTDIRSARPAGTPFEYAGHFYRPAQDCSKTGGGRITINRVERLTPTEFQEEPVAVIEPFRDSPYKEGVHTLSAVGDHTLIDGKQFRFVPNILLTNITKGFKLMKQRIEIAQQDS